MEKNSINYDFYQKELHNVCILHLMNTHETNK